MNAKFFKQIIILGFCFFLKIECLDASKNVLFVCGELSGDKLASWYLKNLKKTSSDLQVHAIGGEFLAASGAKIIDDYRAYSLQLLGLFSFIKNIPNIWKLNSNLIEYVSKNSIEEVVLVDLPLVNVPLARSLKKRFKDLKITYVAPPELWAWGNFGISSLLKKYCDKIVVIYPFEVEFYKELGLKVDFVEYPHLADLEQVLIHSNEEKEPTVALLVGSRPFELDLTLPLISKFVERFKASYPEVKFIIPLAESIPPALLNKKLVQYEISSSVEVVVDEKTKRLSKCFCAVTKPGTSTLELALLKVPAVVILKISRIQYFIFKFLSPLKFLSLPNILSKKEVFKELIQEECHSNNIFLYVSILYRQFRNDRQNYNLLLGKIGNVTKLLRGK